MQAFFTLIGRLLIVAGVQIFATSVAEEYSSKRVVPVINIVCNLFSYFLLLVYVYNHIGDFLLF